MPMIKGRNYKRVPKNKDGSCPKGVKKYRRSGNKKFSCYKLMAGGKKRKRRRK